MIRLFKKKKKEEEKEEKEPTPPWAEAAQYADRIKILCEDMDDVTYLVALKSVVEKLNEFLDAKIKKLEAKRK